MKKIDIGADTLKALENEINGYFKNGILDQGYRDALERDYDYLKACEQDVIDYADSGLQDSITNYQDIIAEAEKNDPCYDFYNDGAMDAQIEAEAMLNAIDHTYQNRIDDYDLAVKYLNEEGDCISQIARELIVKRDDAFNDYVKTLHDISLEGKRMTSRIVIYHILEDFKDRCDLEDDLNDLEHIKAELTELQAKLF